MRCPTDPSFQTLTRPTDAEAIQDAIMKIEARDYLWSPDSSCRADEDAADVGAISLQFVREKKPVRFTTAVLLRTNVLLATAASSSTRPVEFPCVA